MSESVYPDTFQLQDPLPMPIAFAPGEGEPITSNNEQNRFIEEQKQNPQQFVIVAAPVPIQVLVPIPVPVPAQPIQPDQNSQTVKYVISKMRGSDIKVKISCCGTKTDYNGMDLNSKKELFQLQINYGCCCCAMCGNCCDSEKRDIYFHMPGKNSKGLQMVEPPKCSCRAIFGCEQKGIRIYYTGENSHKFIGTIEDPYARYCCLDNKCQINGQCVCKSNESCKDICSAQNGWLDINFFCCFNLFGITECRCSFIERQCLNCGEQPVVAIYDKDDHRKYLVTFPTCQIAEFCPCSKLNFIIRDMYAIEVARITTTIINRQYGIMLTTFTEKKLKWKTKSLFIAASLYVNQLFVGGKQKRS